MILILYGAGKIGRDFIRSPIYRYFCDKYESLVFIDNDQNKEGEIEGIPILHNLMYEAEKHEVIITSGAWYEIYESCILDSIEPVGIYCSEIQKVVSYEEMCFVTHSLYRNRKCIRYEHEREKQIEMAVQSFVNTGSIFDCTVGVAIMLSNLCNYACMHSKCPAAHIKDKQILPAKTVYRIIDELATRDYEGVLYFHVYNEPMIDPRLFMFIKYAKEHIPKSKVLVYSNGYYFNQQMADELGEIGADILAVTGYGGEEYRRLLTIKTSYSYRIVWGNLDERLNLYEKGIRNTEEVKYKKCRSMLSQVNIFSDGEIGTCCLDYGHPYKLGNIINKTLKECLDSKNVVDFQNRLLKCDRSCYPICQNCGWVR